MVEPHALITLTKGCLLCVHSWTDRKEIIMKTTKRYSLVIGIFDAGADSGCLPTENHRNPNIDHYDP